MSHYNDDNDPVPGLVRQQFRESIIAFYSSVLHSYEGDAPGSVLAKRVGIHRANVTRSGQRNKEPRFDSFCLRSAASNACYGVGAIAGFAAYAAVYPLVRTYFREREDSTSGKTDPSKVADSEKPGPAKDTVSPEEACVLYWSAKWFGRHQLLSTMCDEKYQRVLDKTGTYYVDASEVCGTTGGNQCRARPRPLVSPQSIVLADDRVIVTRSVVSLDQCRKLVVSSSHIMWYVLLWVNKGGEWYA